MALARPPGQRGRVTATAARCGDLVRDEIVLSADTWVVKVGTSVLTGPDGTLDPARIGHLAEQISAVIGPGPQGRAGQLRRGRARAWASSARPTRPDNLPQLQAAAAVGQAYLIQTYDEGLRRHGRHAAQLLLTARRLRQPHALPEHAQHPARPVRLRRRADHQRERHGQRRRDQVRRQRPAGGDGHQPAPGAAAGHSERRRRPVSRPTRPPARRPSRPARAPDRRRGPGPGRREPQRAGHRRHAEQAGRGPAGDPRPAAR